MSNLVDKLVAVQMTTGANIDYLGHLCWFSIGELRVTRENLEAAMEDANLDKKCLPRPINPRDAFRRATSALEVKRQVDETAPQKDPEGNPLPPVYINYLVREVLQDKEQIVRHLVRERVDAQNVVLEYQEVLRFRIQDETLEVKRLDYTVDDLDEIEDKVRRLYNIERHHHNERHVREIIMEIIGAADAVSVRNTGAVYFIPKTFQETVDGLKVFARHLDQYRTGDNPVRFWAIPVVTAEEHGEMVQEALEVQVETESKLILEEIARLLKGEGRKITPLVARQYAERARKLREMVSRYETLLQTEITKVQSALELVTAGATQLFEKVEV